MRNLIVMGALLAAGCATIVGERTQVVGVNSVPSDAEVVITDENGNSVFKGSTPVTATLHKSDGSYWGGKTYTVSISKQGYKEQSISVKASPNGWYIAGNLVFGGLIGWFIVDPFNGGMYTLSPEQLDASLGETAAHNNRSSDGNISIVLLEDVPASLRDQLVRIDQ